MTGVSLLGQALRQIDNLKTQQTLLNDLSLQFSTGKKTQKFSGLGADVITSKRARADFTSLDTYLQNITNTDRRIQLMLTSINEYRSQGENLSGMLIGFSQESVHQEGDVVYYDDPLTIGVDEHVPVGMSSADPDMDFTVIRDTADKMYDLMIDLLNIQDENGRYLLGGAETLTQPVSNNGFLESAISQQLTDWKNGTITSEDFIANLKGRDATTNPDAITDTIVGYSAPLSSGEVGNVHSRISDRTEVDYTVLANEQAFRDILVGLSFLRNENLPPIADTYLPEDAPYPAPPSEQGAPGATLDEQRENFFEVYNSVAAMVNQALDKVSEQSYKLENVRVRIDTVRESHENVQNLLLKTVDEVENTDPNEVAVKLSMISTQLDASYRIAARLQELSLVNFI